MSCGPLRLRFGHFLQLPCYIIDLQMHRKQATIRKMTLLVVLQQHKFIFIFSKSPQVLAIIQIDYQ